MMPPSHIGLVGPLPPPYGGMANQTQQLAELLRSEGLQVSLVQTNPPYFPQWISNLPVVRAFFRLLPYLYALWRLAGRCDVMHVMANSGWSWHLFAAPAVWIAKLRKVPVVVNYRGGEAETFLARSARSVRITMCQASRLIVPSGFLKAVFTRFDMPVSVVPNIIDIARFNNPAPYRTKRNHLLVARNLEPIYDNETAIRAFFLVHRSNPDATLTIAGSGPLAESLKALAKSLGLEKTVIFAGRLDRDAMAEAYRAADIALNPSLVDNMPNSVLEAMASGIPVVSTYVGGVPYIVTDEQTALLVPPNSPETMANAILRLMNDTALSNKLVDNSLAEVQKYTWQQVWPQLAELYGRSCNITRLPA